jgi:hypothetical protein
MTDAVLVPYPLRGGSGDGYARPSVVGIRRTRLWRRVLRAPARQRGIAALLALTLAATGFTEVEYRRSFDAARVPGMEVVESGPVGGSLEPGDVQVLGLLVLKPTGPVTLLDARPLSVGRGFDLIATRVVVLETAAFTSDAIYRVPRYIAPGCVHGRPVTGYGPTYPVRGMRLDRGDAVEVFFYLRATRLGWQTARGYQVTYRSGGRLHSAIGDASGLESFVRVRGPDEPTMCTVEEPFVKPAPGYPA